MYRGKYDFSFPTFCTDIDKKTGWTTMHSLEESKALYYQSIF